MSGSPTISVPGLEKIWPEGTPPDVTSICSAPASKVPGSYVILFALGDLTGSTFTGSGLWFLENLAKGTPGPTPTPGVTPTPIKGKPLYLYYGTFRLKTHKEQGCVFMIATKSGKPLSKKAKGNAEILGTVATKVKYLRVTFTTTSGSVSAKLSGVSATGGAGSAVLLSSTGAAYDKATISILGRVSIP
jgi:hypothetical protein